jgi:aminobenzoyl-glutamate utilization protein B
VMAGTAVAVMTDETLMARAKKDHQERLGRTPYVCPIPAEVNPPLQPRPKVA